MSPATSAPAPAPGYGRRCPRLTFPRAARPTPPPLSASSAPQLSGAPGRRSGAPRSTLAPAARTARAAAVRRRTRTAAGWSVAPPAAVSHSLGIPPWHVFPIEGNLVFRRANNHSPYSSGEALGSSTLEDYLPLFPDTWAVYFSLRPAASRTMPSVPERGLRAWHQSPGCACVRPWVRDPSHLSTPPWAWAEKADLKPPNGEPLTALVPHTCIPSPNTGPRALSLLEPLLASALPKAQQGPAKSTCQVMSAEAFCSNHPVPTSTIGRIGQTIETLFRTVWSQWVRKSLGSPGQSSAVLWTTLDPSGPPCYPGLDPVFQLPRCSLIKRSVIPSVRKVRDDPSVLLFSVR